MPPLARRWTISYLPSRMDPGSRAYTEVPPMTEVRIVTGLSRNGVRPHSSNMAGETSGSFRGMRRFLILWAGQAVSMLGTGLGSFALGVWVFKQTGSTTQYAMISVATGLALIVMNPVSGALADRRDRRQLLLLSNVGAGLMSLLMA